jgi:hypothetical protein
MRSRAIRPAEAIQTFTPAGAERLPDDRRLLTQGVEYVATEMDGFVAKPIEISRLFAAMRDAVG